MCNWGILTDIEVHDELLLGRRPKDNQEQLHRQQHKINVSER